MKPLNIPERFTGTIYIHANCDPSSYSYGSIWFFEMDISDACDDRILVGQIDVDVPLDASGTVDKQVAKLRRSKQEIIDRATERANQIDEAIESLLAIEHQEES